MFYCMRGSEFYLPEFLGLASLNLLYAPAPETIRVWTHADLLYAGTRLMIPTRVGPGAAQSKEMIIFAG